MSKVQEIVKQSFESALTYEQYHELFEKQSKADVPDDNDAKSLHEYAVLNFRRATRIEKTYKVSEQLSEKLQLLTKPLYWLVITEPWCGDSAQIMSQLAAMANIAPRVELRILLRDQHLEIMDLYLTNGTARAIPKLIAFDEESNEVFTWGPRPDVAAKLVRSRLDEGIPKTKAYEELHGWYARNKGKDIEAEFEKLLFW